MSSPASPDKQRDRRPGRRLKASLAMGYRTMTAGYRALPDFVIIGTQKGGSTSLYHYLARHPRLVPSAFKEVHYFDSNFDRGERWYRAHFPFRARLTAGRRTFEASPAYLLNPRVPERMAGLLPEVRLIALLRNPVERAISGYFMQQRKGRENLPILEALRAEERRLAPYENQGDYANPAFRYYSYKRRGRYAEQLRQYLGFFRREQLYVTSSERFFERPSEVMAEICRFLDLEPGPRLEGLTPYNIGSNKREVPAEVLAYLDEYFAPHNRALYELIGEDFGW